MVLKQLKIIIEKLEQYFTGKSYHRSVAARERGGGGGGGKEIVSFFVKHKKMAKL